MAAGTWFKRVLWLGILSNFALAVPTLLVPARMVELTRVPPAVVAQAPAAGMTQTTSLASTTQASDYAAREAAAPALSEFKGGEATIFIGGSALAVLVVVLLIILII